MKEIYKKTARFTLISGIILSIVAVVYFLLSWIGWKSSGEFLIQIVMLALSLFTGSWFFNRAFENAPEPIVVKSGEQFLINELIFQQMPSFIPKTVLVNNEGQHVYTIKPTDRQPIRRWLCSFVFFTRGWFFPVTYDVLNVEGIRMASFHFKNEWKRMMIYIGDADNELIGHVEFPFFKNTVKHRGILVDSQGNEWRSIEAKSIAGDVDIRDEENRITASYRYGMFPYTLHPAFEAIPFNYHVRLGDHIDEKERKAYTGIFFYWYLLS